MTAPKLDRNDLVMRLWNDEKVSMTLIGKQVGISKSAVAGIIYRARRDKGHVAAAGFARQAAEVEPIEPSEIAKRIAALIAGKGGFCSFPMWPHGAKPDHTYCGAPRRDRMAPYCAEHMERCYTPATRVDKRLVWRAA